MRNKVLNILFALVAMLSVMSCASHKDSADILKKKNIAASGSLSVVTADKDLTAPAKLMMSQGNIIRLQVMMPILGSELFRVEFTPESVLVLDRMNKQYAQESYSAVNTLVKSNLSFDKVQALVLQYLAEQKELPLALPAGGKTYNVTLKGSFHDIKEVQEVDQPTVLSSKFKKMSIKDITKMLK